MSDYNDKKLEQLIYKFEAMEEQVKVLGDTVSKLQKDCQWYRKKITQLESQLVGFQKKGADSGGSGKCKGMGYLRGGAQRERCTIRGEMACTSCGECGKKPKI